jgi:hypothetical protein
MKDINSNKKGMIDAAEATVEGTRMGLRKQMEMTKRKVIDMEFI